MSWDKIDTTRYFREEVLNKRPYLKPEWIQNILLEQKSTMTQEDGRIRYWGFVKEVNQYLRVVLLDDNKTVHNAFFDRDFKEVDYEVPLSPRD